MDPIDMVSALVQMMAWHRWDAKQSFEPMLTMHVHQRIYAWPQ